jgi:hypothetical protein
MKNHLAALGYTNVYNKREDFYKSIQDGKVPEYGVYECVCVYECVYVYECVCVIISEYECGIHD